MCVLSIKVAIQKKSGNIFNDPHINIYIYIYIYTHTHTHIYIYIYIIKLVVRKVNILKWIGPVWYLGFYILYTCV